MGYGVGETPSDGLISGGDFKYDSSQGGDCVCGRSPYYWYRALVSNSYAMATKKKAPAKKAVPKKK